LEGVERNSDHHEWRVCATTLLGQGWEVEQATRHLYARPRIMGMNILIHTGFDSSVRQ